MVSFGADVIDEMRLHLHMRVACCRASHRALQIVKITM